MPVPWFTSLDSLASILIVPFLIILWRAQAKRGSEPGDLGKIGIGAALMAASMATLALGAWLTDSGKVSVIFPLIAFTLSGVSFMWSWPTLLALVSRHAPKQISSLSMAVVYLTGFLSGVVSGYIASYYESLGATAFWLMNAVISLTGGIAIVLLGPMLKRAMAKREVEI